MASGAKVNGIAIGMIGIGGFFCYAGVKGFSVTQAIQAVIQGKSPAKLSQANAIGTPEGTSSSSGGSSSSAVTPASGNELDVIKAILQSLGAPANNANTASMTAWIERETPWPPVAKFNPMNSTMDEPGASTYNSVGVKNYTSWAQGVSATVATINNGNYPNIISALKSGTGLINNPSVASDLSKWSGGGYSSV